MHRDYVWRRGRDVFFMQANKAMDSNTFENFLLGKCTADEHRAVEDWFMRHIDSDELDSMCLDALGRMSGCQDRRQAEQSYRKLRRRMGLRRQLPWMRGAARIAVAAAVMALLAVGAYIMGRGSAHDTGDRYPQLAQLAAPGQGTLTAVLPDSTTVVLRPGSRIVYDLNSFAAHRDLMLFGDAYFEVTHDAAHAFTVRCRDAEVQVLGTRFDVHSHDDDLEFEVALYDGSVKLASAFNYHADTLLLRPGEVAKVNKATGGISTMRLAGLDYSPGDSTLVFIDRPLHDIINTLHRRSGVNIILSNPRLGDVKFFAIVGGDESPERVLKTLSLSEPMTIRRLDASTIEIR